MATKTSSRSQLATVLGERRLRHHVPSGMSSKKYDAFFSDDDSPRSHRTKHYSDEESYSEDDSFYRPKESKRYVFIIN